MIKIFYKNDKDGSLSLVLKKETCNCSIVFNSYSFILTDNDKINLNEFELLDTKQILVSLDEIRNNEFDVFYFKMNNELIFQISWIPYDSQQLYVFDKSKTSRILDKTIYEEAMLRFMKADEYEDLSYPFWR
ncbi:MAG: hypothetical protein LBN27_03675 [Prevotellaceae bacterium]|jgi:hypothetical protein|nr:hypothetical protein [Prevotellaceae bacterium]